MGDELEELEDGPGALVIDVDALVTTDFDGYDHDEVTLFLERIASGWGEHEAGIARPLGWSLLKIRKFIELDGIKDLLWTIRETENESVERAALKTAQRGNPAAQKWWLVNKAGHRGWADRRTVTMEGEVDHNVVVSVKQALDEQTRYLVEQDNAEGIAALQRAIGLGDDPEYDVIDAEVIDDDGD